jgi:hypothetical protein
VGRGVGAAVGGTGVAGTAVGATGVGGINVGGTGVGRTGVSAATGISVTLGAGGAAPTWQPVIARTSTTRITTRHCIQCDCAGGTTGNRARRLGQTC